MQRKFYYLQNVKKANACTSFWNSLDHYYQVLRFWEASFIHFVPSTHQEIVYIKVIHCHNCSFWPHCSYNSTPPDVTNSIIKLTSCRLDFCIKRLASGFCWSKRSGNALALFVFLQFVLIHVLIVINCFHCIANEKILFMCELLTHNLISLLLKQYLKDML